MQHPSKVLIQDFNYNLPVNRIAVEPLDERDQSKLLLYKNKKIHEDVYRNVAQHLPENSLLIFNNTRVIYARMHFTKSTGSTIEVFCLEPIDAVQGYDAALSIQKKVRWNCLVGGIAKWKEPTLTQELVFDNKPFLLNATLINKQHNYCEIEFAWTNELTFSEVLQIAGNVPLPPYIKRKAGEADKERYQTAYAKTEGSVAAPTAGLHFTQSIFESLKNKKIDFDFLTLHVGAGTFKPVSAPTIGEHEMHGEWFVVTKALVNKILASDFIVAVGTTSLRTLETLYWLGVKAHLKIENPLSLSQWEVYDEKFAEIGLSKIEALESLLTYMEYKNINFIYSQTHILIAPGYTFRIAKALITNFHQPQSTLLLLVAAAIGENWKRVYEYAMQNDFRFLSFGDGSLLYFD